MSMIVRILKIYYKNITMRGGKSNIFIIYIFYWYLMETPKCLQNISRSSKFLIQRRKNY